MELGYLQFDEIERRLDKNMEDLDRVFATLTTGIDKIAKQEFRTEKREGKLRRLEKRARELARLPQYRSQRWQEILVEAIMKTKSMPRSHHEYIFGHTQYEGDLYRVVALFFKRAKFTVYDGDKGRISIGGSIPELIAIRKITKRREVDRYWGLKTEVKTQRSVRVVAVDVKTGKLQLKRFYDQATDYQDGSDEVYLATTSWLLLSQGVEKVVAKLRQIGVGLVHVDATAEKCEIRLNAKRGKTFARKEKNKLLQQCARIKGIRY